MADFDADMERDEALDSKTARDRELVAAVSAIIIGVWLISSVVVAFWLDHVIHKREGQS
jgi:hypothetical protein